MNHKKYLCDAIRVSLYSNCIRRRVGAIIVKNDIIIGVGYNGVPEGAKNCSEIQCIRTKLNIPSGQHSELCRAVHAEQNAILHAAQSGEKTEGATIYVTTSPCNTCAKLIVNAGIKEVIYIDKYDDVMTDKLFDEVNMKTKQIKK